MEVETPSYHCHNTIAYTYNKLYNECTSCVYNGDVPVFADSDCCGKV